jgi:AAA+ superfamily predicted ATPase
VPIANLNTPPPTPVHPAFDRELRTLLKSGQQLITIGGCTEMHRASQCIQQIAKTMGKDPIKDAWTVFIWNPSAGFTWSNVDANREMMIIPFFKNKAEAAVYKNPEAALQIIPAIPVGTPGCKRAIFLFMNLHLYLDSLPLRDLLETLVDGGHFTSSLPENPFKRPVILLHPAGSLHKEIRHYAVPVTFPPANEADHIAGIEYVGDSIMTDLKPCPVDLKERMAASMLGLTRQQGEDVTAKCLADNREWHEDMLVMIEEAKAAQIGQEGYLTYVPRKAAPGMDDIGGWGNAEAYVRRQCVAYTPSGRRKKLKVPRGILALGLPGTGKSYFAKMITRIIYDVTGQVFPTYKLNYDALFGGIVGETESNIRRLLEILAAQRRYILVVDEMEKFLGTSGSENDGGVSRKASAKFLDWLAERVLRTDDDTDYGYVIGTMNSLAGLEPEFLRRFNATFFVDLPDDATRLEILKIQLRLNHVDPTSIVGVNGKPLLKADWATLVAGTKDFSGSEIEGGVILARELAAEARPEDDAARPTFEEMIEAIAIAKQSIMARVHADRIEQIREWCTDRALPVHVASPVASTSPRRGGRSVDVGN